jgi:hypothetical protein
MANLGDPHSNCTDFFIAAKPLGEALDGKHVVFGKVVQGMGVVRYSPLYSQIPSFPSPSFPFLSLLGHRHRHLSPAPSRNILSMGNDSERYRTEIVACGEGEGPVLPAASIGAELDGHTEASESST